ncbi:MAG: PEGA domain-containing protein [Desulfuromonadales bacterium]
MPKKIVAAILLLIFSTACAPQTALFLSEPPGARVLVNGEEIGQTPCDYRYGLGAGGKYEITMAKDGYEPVQQLVVADETHVGARNRWLAAGVVWSPLWLGAFFTKKLKDGYEFVLKRSAPTMTAQVQ